MEAISSKPEMKLSLNRSMSFQSSPAFIHASGVLDFLLDRTALWVGRLRKVGIDLQRRHIGLHRVAWLQ